jgi:hypothetical protein
VAGVVERAQHAGNVAQRRTFFTSQCERLCRLTFEIDNDERSILALEHLAQVIVAVVACLERAGQSGQPVGAAQQGRRVNLDCLSREGLGCEPDLVFDGPTPGGNVRFRDRLG